ncbi:carboxymuconolactone decarboxylase family protein [Chitinophaga sp.]|uniref:carboxymuconolactone decarboxylase family protein n=1 Tax=Chitinophaga sp. TaxID=1869181 RepID=UPI002C5E7268|nr:carboxymuconolactone decarboxylase family protein [Chitinophaga sp.]HWV65246.1 carboxymuconolactone decarboxylase family protein [Chitinophaga sp.]
MAPISLPDITAISEVNRNYITYFNRKIGHVPNLYRFMMHSDHAFNTYYAFHSRETSLSLRELEAVSLVVAQVNRSLYCLSAHTMIARLNGFSDEEIRQMRKGTAGFDPRLDALVKLVKSFAGNKGKNIAYQLNNFFSAGYTREHFIDVLQAMGENFISNLTAKTLNVPIDFPLAPELPTDENISQLPGED